MSLSIWLTEEEENTEEEKEPHEEKRGQMRECLDQNEKGEKKRERTRERKRERWKKTKEISNQSKKRRR